MQVSVRLVLLPLLLLAVSPVQAAGDPDNGARLTQTWCSGCHAAGASGADVAPPLREIAARPGRTQAYLYAWLTDPHPPMPRLDLSNRQIADLMAYLATLSKQP
ncbi:cytochrome c [Constrictibacter sp. MBR-5]|jgi:mono/diheme cytochrome c family protein|uniref:c-type cytochrome n=1 Tax=Constrictibacter sp. MBR-5 TaxID=3156467 RepID=UPI003390E6CB